MNCSRRDCVILALTICLLASLIAHAYIGSYSRFLADDYCFAAVGESRGILGGTLLRYQRWNGRFSSNFFNFLIASMGQRVPQYNPGIIVTIWFSMLIISLYQFPLAPDRRTRFYSAFLLAAIILFSTLKVTPTVAQSLYWGTGMRSKVSPLILITAYAGLIQCVLRQIHLSKIKLFIWMIAGAGLVFVAAGFNETYLVFQTTALSIALFAGFLMSASDFKKRFILFMGVGLFCSLVAMTIVTMAPGNQIRQALNPATPDLLKLAGIALWSLYQFVIKILKESPVAILGLLGTAILSGKGLLHDNIPDKSLKNETIRMLIWIPPVSLLLMLSCFLPSAYGLSGAPPGRSLIAPSFILICALTGWGYMLGRIIYTKNLKSLQNEKKSTNNLMIYCFLFLYSFYLIWNTYGLLQLQPVFSKYAAAWDASDKMIREAKRKGMTAIIVPQTRNWAGLEDIGSDPRHWINLCVSDYYNINVLAK